MKIRTPIKPMVIREKSYAPHFAIIAALWLLASYLDSIWR